MDKAFAVLGNQGYVARYWMHELKCFGGAPDHSYDKWTGYRDISFIPESNEPKQPGQEEELPKLAIVGTDGKE